MKFLIALLFACALSLEYHEMPLKKAWRLWNVEFGNSELMMDSRVANSTASDRRFHIFADHYARVKMHNSLPDQSFTLALNKFAAITNDEFRAIHNGYRGDADRKPMNIREGWDGVTDLPNSVDWRDQGYVTPIKNQGSCGSCWAFSTVVSLEGQYMKNANELVSLSEQDLVDCVKNVVLPGERQSCCDGCNGGLMDYAFQYMMDKQDGVDDTEDSYPYKGRDGTCKFTTGTKADKATIASYTDVKKTANDLAEAIANVGPISVAVNANVFWQLYHGGVLNPVTCPGNRLDHGVAAVGYGSDGGKDYWIIKNSWGTTWGEKGYMRLAKGDNTCGVQNSASYPDMA